MNILKKLQGVLTITSDCKNDNNIIVNKNQIMIDGEVYSTEECDKVSVVVNGSVGNIDAKVCKLIHVHGDAKSIKTVNGDIQVDGNVECDEIKTTNGDITIRGNATAVKIKTTNGDINM